MSKPILCVDFDGVIHSYTSGWHGIAEIKDPPVEGAIAFLRRAVEDFEVHVFSSRSSTVEGRGAMQQWLCKWASEVGRSAWVNEIKFPNHKPPARVSIDDRCLLFTGEWPAIKDLLLFEPWNKRSKS